MPLPSDFVFSQNNLQDFIDCPRRFQLRHLLHIAWPAPVSEPIKEHEHLVQMGTQFHRMVHQFHLGIPEEIISRHVDDEDVQTWWHSFLNNPPAYLPLIRKTEIYLSMPFESYRLAAKIDLLAVEKGDKAVIVDWKTTHKPPHPNFAQNHIQSIVYPYLVMHTGSILNDFKPFDPDQVSMIYWFPAFPDKSILINFDQAWLSATRNKLVRLVQQISTMNMEIFPLTSDTDKCKFCRYRSLCDRGITAGNLDDEEDGDGDDTPPEINFDEIQGIAF